MSLSADRLGRVNYNYSDSSISTKEGANRNYSDDSDHSIKSESRFDRRRAVEAWRVAASRRRGREMEMGEVRYNTRKHIHTNTHTHSVLSL